MTFVKKIIMTTLISVLFVLILVLTSTFASAQSCKVVAAGPGSYSDQLFRMMQKYNPEFQIQYRTSVYDITAIEYMSQNPEYMLIAAPMMYSKQNPRPNPRIDMLRVHSTTNAAIVTGKNITVKDLETAKLNVAIPGFGFYPHFLTLKLQEKNPGINIVLIRASDAAILLKNGDIDIYIHNEPFIDSFAQPLGFTKISVIPADRESNLNGIRTVSLHFAGIFVHQNATMAQRDNINRCLDSVSKNSAYIENMSKIGATSRLNDSDAQRNRYLNDFISLLRSFDL